jgi:hypothetical protein
VLESDTSTHFCSVTSYTSRPSQASACLADSPRTPLPVRPVRCCAACPGQAFVKHGTEQ